MICYLFDVPKYFVFISGAQNLLYYSHIPAIIISLILSILIFAHDRKQLHTRLLAGLLLTFSIWTFLNLILWTGINSDILLFIWSLFGILQALIAILSIYFTYTFINKRDVGVKIKLVFLILLLPVLLLSSTDLHVSGYNITDCDAFGYEGVAFHAYYSLLGVMAMVWILALLAAAYRKASDIFKKEILLMGIGLEFFLFTFFIIVFVSSYLADIGITQDSSLEMYSLFGMIFFSTLITIQIVKFKSFNIALSATGALVVALLVLVSTQFTFATSTISIVLTAITLFLTLLISIILIRSVRKEVKQREKLEKITKQLEIANQRLKELDKQKSEFVSIASHQLRSPLTAMRGYASMLAEGSFGKLPEKAHVAAERIETSAKLMAMSIEDYLNVSRIESGNMKYNLSNFNVRDMVDTVCDDLRAEAMKKGLILLFRSNLQSQGIVNADVGKTNQIIHNLINNSLKYTPKGSINVFVRDDLKKKRVYIDITDTGIGMSEKTRLTLFQKFSRADNANSVNVSGTGLGLYVGFMMAEEMGGTITSSSEGDGKGSTFTFELPLVM